MTGRSVQQIKICPLFLLHSSYLPFALCWFSWFRQVDFILENRTRFERNNPSGSDHNWLTSLGIAALPGLFVLRGEIAKAMDFDLFAVLQCLFDRLKHFFDYVGCIGSLCQVVSGTSTPAVWFPMIFKYTALVKSSLVSVIETTSEK